MNAAAWSKMVDDGLNGVHFRELKYIRTHTPYFYCLLLSINFHSMALSPVTKAGERNNMK
jgi:hypothetical protein